MNFLAKHFFDYQSFVNLPHKAVQLHKTPPSQSGIDPSAGMYSQSIAKTWGPKSLHTAGKNLPTPGARANRNNVEVKPGGHRHGRPSKLEHREWGERKGELKPEKINPHKEIWMVQWEKKVKHLNEDDEESYILDYFTKSSQKDEMDCQILVILTFVKTGFITVTLKKIKGLMSHIHPKVKVQLFDSGTLLDERVSGKKSENRPATPRRTPSPIAMNHVNAARPAAVNAQPVGNHVGHHPAQQLNQQQIELIDEEPEPINIQDVQDIPREMINEISSPPVRRASFQRRRFSRDLEDEVDISESFLMHLPLQKLYSSYIVLQVFDDESGSENDGIIGSCTIGFVSSSRSAFHWRQMIRKHEHPVCVWHRLQKTVAKKTCTS